MWIGILAVLVAGFLGGLTPIVLKFGLKEFPPLLLTTLRFVIATIIFLPFFYREKQKFTRKGIITLSTQSVFFSFNVIFFGVGIQYTTAIVSQIAYTLVPIIVMMLSYYLLHEQLTRNKIIGLCIAVVGMGVLLQQSVVSQDITTFGTPLGNILVLCAVLSWSFYLVVLKRLTTTYSPITTSFISFFITTVILFCVIPFEYMIRPVSYRDITMIGIGSALWLGIISSALMFFLVQFAVKKTNPFTTSFFQYVGPFSSALFAIPFLGEKVTWNLVFAGLLTIIGVFYATTYPLLKKYFPSVLQ